MENNFVSFSKSIKISLQKQLHKTSSSFLEYSQTIHPDLRSLLPLLLEHAHTGKMIRGILVVLGFTLSGKTNNDIIKIATAFEILHTSILIHDDIIDNSLIRRGKPTLHRVLKRTKHYGISQAICLGDLGFFLATKILTQTSFSAYQKTKIIDLFSEMMLQTIMGEMLDVSFSQQTVKKENDILVMQKLKTAYYTIVWPLTIGAILGGINKKTQAAIKQFGETLGIAFQIQDDILGIFGNEKSLGKSVISDIAEGKNTLLISYAWTKANAKQKRLLKKYYGSKTITFRECAIVKKIFIDTGALSYAQTTAQRYVTQSQKEIALITKNPQLSQFLHEFSHFITARNN